MPDKESHTRHLFKHLWPHAAWDGIRTLIVLGGGVVIAGILTLLQWLRHHVDFVAILSVLIVGILMLIIATVLTERPSPAAKKIPQGHPMPVCTIQTTEEWTRV